MNQDLLPAAPPESTPSRRDFLSSCLRYPALAGLAWLAYVLVRRSTHPALPECSRPIVCGSCRQFVRCELPKAAASRLQGS